MPPVAAASLFGPNQRIDGGNGSSESRRVAAVADDAGNVYAVWQDNRNGDWDVLFARSQDGGRTFGAPVRLGGDRAVGTIQERPAIALAPRGEIVVAWHDDRMAYADFDIFASKSSDRGASFSSPVHVSDGDPGTLQLAPSVAVDGLQRVFVAWQDFRSGNGDIRGAQASLAIFTFGPSVRVDDDAGTGTQSTPSVVATSLGVVHVAYHDNRTGHANVYLATSTDGGDSFRSSVRVDDTGTSTTAQGLVSLAADSVGRLYAVWQDDRGGDFDIYFSRSNDGGRTWSTNVRVDDGQRGANQRSPRIVVGNAGTLYVAWEDERNVDSDVYFTYSRNGGTSWVGGVRVDDAPDSTTDPAYQYGPVVVESNTGLVSLLWQDGRTDNGDIYGATAYLAVGAAVVVDVRVEPQTLVLGGSAQVTISVTSNGTGVDGATLSLSANASGSFGPISALGSGAYATSFTPSIAPTLGLVPIAITAGASKVGFLSGQGQGLVQVIPGLQVAIASPSTTIAVGQRMTLMITVASVGTPVPGASLFAATSRGGSLKPTDGGSDGSGRWTTVFEPLPSAGGTTVTITASANKDGYGPGSAQIRVSVLSQPLPLEVSLTSARYEMMSSEVARFFATLKSNGAPVTGGTIVPSCLKGGTFSPVTDLGNGTYVFDFTAPYVAKQSWIAVNVQVSRPAYENAVTRYVLLLDPNMSNPERPTPVLLQSEPEATYIPSGSTVSVSIYLYTVDGYVVSGATLAVALWNSAHGTLSAVTDRLNGVYTFTFTAAMMGGETGVLIRVTATKLGYATVSAKVGLIVYP